MNFREVPYVTRVLAPQKRVDTLHRRRLVDFIHEQIECRLILISAAAGYGKTTLLVDFVHSFANPVCWYSLAEADKDPKVFLEYLLASIRQRFPGFGARTLGLLDEITDLPKDLSSVIGILVNEMHDSIPEYFFIVLDDYHHVDDSPLVNEALDLLLHYLPSNCHIILSSRTLPRITLSRLAAQRVVAGLGLSDLRFTVQEIKEFLRNSFKVLLPDSLALELAQTSEGWITGIVLSTFGMGQGMLETILRARNSGSPVFDYLANEVFQQQPLETRLFLLESSILRHFSAQRCAEVLGISNAPELLKAIEERNLFVTRTEGNDWCQYHNLFAAFLQGKLKTEYPERFVELNRRAGEVCREQDEVDDAVLHFTSAGRFDKVAETIEAHGEKLLNVGKLQTVQRWLEAVPAETVEMSPALLLLKGRVGQAGQLDEALRCYSRAADLFELKGDKRSATRALLKQSTVRRLMGLRSEAIGDCMAALARSTGDEEVEAEARKGIGIIRGMEGKFSESILALTHSLALYEKLGSTHQTADLTAALGAVYYSKGDLPTACEFFQRALGLWEKLDNTSLAASIMNNLALISYLRGENEGALSLLREAIDKVHATGYLRTEAHILDTLGMVCRDMDDLDEAFSAYEAGLDLARRGNEGPLIAHLLNEIGGIFRLRGDLDRAEQFVRQAHSQAEELGALKEASLGELSLGQLACDRHNFRRAAGHFAKACKGLKAAGAHMEFARACYYTANVYLTQGRQADAEKQMRLLDQTVSTLGGKAFLLGEIKREPRPAEFAESRGIGSWGIQGIRDRAPAAEKPAALPIITPEPMAEARREGLPEVSVHALGQGRVTCGGRDVTDSDWSTQITKELFFYLMAHPRGARRESVLEALWPDLSVARAISSFHVALYRLRRATFPELFIHRGGRYFLNPGVDAWFDVEEFESWVSKALSCGANNEEAVPHWEKVAAIYQGPFLAQFYSEWCESKRRELEERYLQALGAAGRYHFKQGNYSACIACLERILTVDPYAEDVHGQLIKAYALAGDRPSAVRHYNRLVRMLQEELGSEPAPETIAVYNSLLRDAPEANGDQKGKDHRSGRGGK